MKKALAFGLYVLFCMPCALAVDMQAHIGTKEAQDAYTRYLNKQRVYYFDVYAPEELRALSGNDLFKRLNELMAETNKITQLQYSYDDLRGQFVNVDKDLNTTGNIIGFYDGSSMNGTWDNGTTYNREHVWPQSKGADKDEYMGYDMQSVRPASSSINSSRGSKAYGEGSRYYDPDEVGINNSLYVSTNLGSYRGDAARIILYDYVVYGEAGGNKSKLYNGLAQLPVKVGTNGVFQSLPILLKWHMNDPVSLAEMVRNDGAEAYQKNRNPFIDYPELAIQMLKNQSVVNTYDVTLNGAPMWPAYTLTLRDGFIAYLGTKDQRPETVSVTGAQYTYDPENGRLTITSVTGAVTINAPWDNAIELVGDEQQATKIMRNGQILIIKNGKAYNTLGIFVDDVR